MKNTRPAPLLAVVASYVTELIFEVNHLPRPGETLSGHFRVGHGGKGLNMAVAAHRCGVPTLPIMKIGTDEHGRTAREMLLAEGIPDDALLTTAARPSGAGVVLLAEDGQNAIALDFGANAQLTPEEVERFRPQLRTCRVVLAQLESPVPAIVRLFRLAREMGAMTILNPAPAPATALPSELLELTDCLTPNQTEAASLSGIDPVDEPSRLAAAAALRAKGVGHVVLTLGSEGAYLLNETGAWLVPAQPVNAVDTSGAGDAFNGALAAHLALGNPLLESVRQAVRYAGVKVTRRGTAIAMPFAHEL